MGERVVDTHIHVWVRDHPRYPLQVGSDAQPRWEGTAEDYVREMGESGIERAVIVQIPHYGVDHRYALAARARYPGCFAVVGLPDLTSSHIVSDFDRLVLNDRIQGVRISCRPGERLLESVALDPLWRRAGELDVPIIVQIDPSHLETVSRIARRFPQTALVLDHVAGADSFDQLAPLVEVARESRLYLKASHLYGLGRPVEEEQRIGQLIPRLVDAFGPDRLMFGSNWPLVRKRGGLRRCVEDFRAALDGLDGEDRSAILHRTAERLYRWPSPGG